MSNDQMIAFLNERIRKAEFALARSRCGDAWLKDVLRENITFYQSEKRKLIEASATINASE